MKDLSSYDSAIVVGITFDEVPPGSIDGQCGSCGNVIKIGPKSQQVIETNPDADMLTLCMACLIRYRATQGAGMTAEVHRSQEWLDAHK